MSASQVGLNVRGRWDKPELVLTPEQTTALARFHQRTDFEFNRVRDLSLIGQYALLRGWEDIAKALTKQPAEAI